MEVSRLAISASQRGKLIAAGYTTLASLSAVTSFHLARDLNISEDEANAILNAASNSIPLPTDFSHGSCSLLDVATNAWDMLQVESSLTSITTSCAELDHILGGGVSCREVTEIGGVPGIGKTQLGIQLAVNVQIPSDLGGLGGKAVYIDTEGSFMVERVTQIAQACVEDLANYDRFLHKRSKHLNQETQWKNMLENIYYFRVCSYTEQVALVNYLDRFLSENKDVKIVIFDSITFHFRQDFEDLALRTRILSGIALKLMKIAKNFSLAVVLLNQVTTKYTEGSFQLALALGDSWSHSCTNRIILYWKGDERFAYIDKSPSLKSASASFCVTSRGIRNSASTSKRSKLM